MAGTRRRLLQAGRLQVSPEVPPPDRPCLAPTGCPRASRVWGRLQHPLAEKTLLALRARGSVKEEAYAFACLHRASSPKDLTVEEVLGSLSSLEERGGGGGGRFSGLLTRVASRRVKGPLTGHRCRQDSPIVPPR